MTRRFDNTKCKAKVIVLDDDQGIIDTLRVTLEREEYHVTGVTNYKDLIQKLKHNQYDILILDYLLDGEYHGDEVLAMIRPFSDIYTMLLTGHKDLAPPLETLRNLDIQCYFEKTDKLENVLLQTEMAYKSMRYAKNILFNYKFSDILILLREREGWSQEYVAQRIDVHRGTIIDYENGSSNPTYNNLIKLADLFKVNMDLLTGRLLHK